MLKLTEMDLNDVVYVVSDKSEYHGLHRIHELFLIPSSAMKSTRMVSVRLEEGGSIKIPCGVYAVEKTDSGITDDSICIRSYACTRIVESEYDSFNKLHSKMISDIVKYIREKTFAEGCFYNTYYEHLKDIDISGFRFGSKLVLSDKAIEDALADGKTIECNTKLGMHARFRMVSEIIPQSNGIPEFRNVCYVVYDLDSGEIRTANAMPEYIPATCFIVE